MKWKIQHPDNYQQHMDEAMNNPLLAKTLATSSHQLLNKAPFTSYKCLHDIDKALERIQNAIVKMEEVMVFGDYDCDGIMATSIMVRAFALCKLRVNYDIPDRMNDGYGLSVKKVEQFHQQGIRLIITVDNGISSYEAVKRANELGIDVIITDHHDLPEVLPEAYAIVHPFLSENLPYQQISGGFVACKVAEGMIQRKDQYLYCLAAISTISDVMPMVEENRTLVKTCMVLMNRANFNALNLINRENNGVFDTQAIGFTIAPKINAAGRLHDKPSTHDLVQYFAYDGMKTHESFQMRISKELGDLNNLRKRKTEQCVALAHKEFMGLNGAAVIFSPVIEEGVAGLVAARLNRELYCPVFVMTVNVQTGQIKGSARGVDGLDLYDCLKYCKDALLVYGGHEKAAGFSLEAGELEHFETLLARYMKDHLTVDMLEPVQSAIAIEESDITFDNVKGLSLLEPFGNENERPVFMLELPKPRLVNPSRDKKHLRMTFTLHDGSDFVVMWFNHGDDVEALREKEHFTLYGEISLNTFNHVTNLQMNLKDLA